LNRCDVAGAAHGIDRYCVVLDAFCVFVSNVNVSVAIDGDRLRIVQPRGRALDSTARRCTSGGIDHDARIAIRAAKTVVGYVDIPLGVDCNTSGTTKWRLRNDRRDIAITTGGIAGYGAAG